MTAESTVANKTAVAKEVFCAVVNTRKAGVKYNQRSLLKTSFKCINVTTNVIMRVVQKSCKCPFMYLPYVISIPIVF